MKFIFDVRNRIKRKCVYIAQAINKSYVKKRKAEKFSKRNKQYSQRDAILGELFIFVDIQFLRKYWTVCIRDENRKKSKIEEVRNTPGRN